MKKLRKIIFWCHLPVGVVAGLVILTMCVTGVLLSFEKQITAWADTRGYRAEQQVNAQLVLDRATGNVVRWEPFSTYTRGRQLRSILRFAHTGEVAGVAGQTIAGLVSLGGAFLVFTGLALAIRRLLGWRARRRAIPTASNGILAPIKAGESGAFE